MGGAPLELCQSVQLFDITIFPEQTGQIRERGDPLEPYQFSSVQLFDVTILLEQTGYKNGGFSRVTGAPKL